VTSCGIAGTVHPEKNKQPGAPYVMANYFNIGKIVAVHGLEGEMILLHKMGDCRPLKDAGVLFIEEKKNSFLPWFIEKVRTKSSEELFVKLEGIATREAAARLISRQVYLDEQNFRAQVKDDSVLYYLGFSVEDRQAGMLGTVAEVVELPGQLLIKVYQDEHELLIPLNESTLVTIDTKKRTVYVDLPEGLLDIYRS
jgi:16S rRNA processing protein RimM